MGVVISTRMDKRQLVGTFLSSHEEDARDVFE